MKYDIRHTALLRYVLGELPAAEAEQLEGRLAGDARLRAEVARLRSIQNELRLSRADSFGPYFGDRVMRRLTTAREGAEALYLSLRWIFARTSVAAAAAAVLIGAYNLAQFGDLAVTSTVWDALFGLPSTDFLDAFLAGPM